jgi:hypothetical protein
MQKLLIAGYVLVVSAMSLLAPWLIGGKTNTE